MLQDVAALLANIKLKKKKRNTFFFNIYTMEHPDFILCSFMENSIGLKKVDSVGYSYLRTARCIRTKNRKQNTFLILEYFSDIE